MDLNKLAEARIRELSNRPKRALQRWMPMIQVVENHMKEQGKIMEDYQKANI